MLERYKQALEVFTTYSLWILKNAHPLLKTVPSKSPQLPLSFFINEEMLLKKETCFIHRGKEFGHDVDLIVTTPELGKEDKVLRNIISRLSHQVSHFFLLIRFNEAIVQYCKSWDFLRITVNKFDFTLLIKYFEKQEKAFPHTILLVAKVFTFCTALMYKDLCDVKSNYEFWNALKKIVKMTSFYNTDIFYINMNESLLTVIFKTLFTKIFFFFLPM